MTGRVPELFCVHDRTVRELRHGPVFFEFSEYAVVMTPAKTPKPSTVSLAVTFDSLSEAMTAPKRRNEFPMDGIVTRDASCSKPLHEHSSIIDDEISGEKLRRKINDVYATLGVH